MKLVDNVKNEKVFEIAQREKKFMKQDNEKK